VQLSEAVSLTYNLVRQLDFDSCKDSFDDVLLWVAFFAGFTAGGTQRQFFITQIQKIAKLKGIKSFEHTQSLLDLFLYRQNIFGSVFLRLWEECMSFNI
jgi:hypothetical protein